MLQFYEPEQDYGTPPVASKETVSLKIDGVEVSIISLHDLRRNKLAAGRHKDLNDLENLPEA